MVKTVFAVWSSELRADDNILNFTDELLCLITCVLCMFEGGLQVRQAGVQVSRRIGLM